MKSLSRQSLVPGVLVLSMLCLALGFLLVMAMREREDLARTTELLKQKTVLMHQINDARREKQRALLSYRFDRRAIYLKALARTESEFQHLVERLERNVTSERERELITSLNQIRARTLSIQDSLVRSIQSGSEEEITAAFHQWTIVSRKLEALLADLTALGIRSLDTELAQMDQTRMGALLAVGITLALALALVLLFGLVARRRVVTPLLEMTRVAQAIAKGDLSLRVSGVERNDEIGHLGTAINDMTRALQDARRDLERNLEELKRSNSDLQQFAYVASHDLKEPLRMMALYAQILERDLGPTLSPKAKDAIKHVTSGAARMRALIDDLLAYSRVSGAEAIESVDCNELVESVKRDLLRAVSESGASIKVERLPVVFANPLLLAQLFENLVSNALKFRGESPPQILISAREEPAQWVISVADNGIGIRREHWDKIFVIFQRLHTHDRYPGTGIGLAICKKIVERHGGRMWVESTEGKGSVFSFSLPKSPPLVGITDRAFAPAEIQ